MKPHLFCILVSVLLLSACGKKKEPPVEESSVTQEAGQPDWPISVDEGINILTKNGFEVVQTADGFVQLEKTSAILVMVDLDTDDLGIHVTPVNKKAAKLTIEMLESAYDVYDLFGVDIRDVDYDIEPAAEFGPQIHTGNIDKWMVRKGVYESGMSGMFVTFDVELRE